jgi:hypothetical protein
MRFIITSLTAVVGLALSMCGQEQFSLGSAVIAAPAGWRETKRTDERLTLSSPNTKQQATISIMRFGAEPSFDDFKVLYQHRLEAEKKDPADIFLRAEPAFEIRGKFGMFYSGAAKKTGRVFSGYLSLVKSELLTIYIESVGVEQDVHLQTFQSFVEGLARE